MTLTAFFQYRLSIAQQKGYAKAIQFEIDPLAGAPLPTQVRSHASAVGGKETGRPLKRRFVSGPGMASRRYNTAKNQKRRAPAFFRQAKAQLALVWPVTES